MCGLSRSGVARSCHLRLLVVGADGARRGQAEQEAQAAHAKEVQSLQQQHEAELGEKERVHAQEQAEAARLEERWQARVREAQSKQREYQIASPHEDEDVFVCYVCMNRVTVL